MNVNDDLLGKTITGVIATTSRQSGIKEIWMLQFADGSHVEFVSPGARKALRSAAKQTARKPARRAVSANMDGQSRSNMAMSWDAGAGPQLSLNVA
jgi:hypothetical protein